MKMSNKVYDVLKWIAMYLLPALSTLYFGLSQTWGLPYGEQVVGTITTIDTFLGIMLGISSYHYQGDGTLTSDPSGDTLYLDLNKTLTPQYLAKKEKLTVRINPNDFLEEDDSQG